MRAPYKSLGPTVYNDRKKKDNHCNTEQNNNLRKLTPSLVSTKEPNICINSLQNILHHTQEHQQQKQHKEINYDSTGM
jgi:hypothetical protein